MLAAQMAVAHVAMMKSGKSFMLAQTGEGRQLYEGSYSRLARTFAVQLEALKRYRTGGEQKITVQHVQREFLRQATIASHSAHSSETPGKFGFVLQNDASCPDLIECVHKTYNTASEVQPISTSASQRIGFVSQKTGGQFVSTISCLALLASLGCRLPAEVRFTKRSQHVGLSPKSMRSAQSNTVGSIDAVVRAPFLLVRPSPAP